MEMVEGKDSFEVVREFLAALGERRPDREEVKAIAWALGDIYQRLMRVRQLAPTVDLSDRMWGLMEMAGIRAKPSRGTGGLRSAASFL